MIFCVYVIEDPILYVLKEYSEHNVLRRCNNGLYQLCGFFMCVSVYGDNFD